jgi:hypothetical protein
LHHLPADIIVVQINQHVVMVGHQAVGQDVDVFRPEVSPHLGDEEVPVRSSEEDGLPVDAPVEEVVIATGQELLRSQAFSTVHGVPLLYGKAWLLPITDMIVRVFRLDQVSFVIFNRRPELLAHGERQNTKEYVVRAAAGGVGRSEAGHPSFHGRLC